MGKYREKYWLLCMLFVFPMVRIIPLTMLRQDARAMLEEITAGNRQDRSMEDLISMLSRRDVRDLLSLVFSFG